MVDKFSFTSKTSFGALVFHLVYHRCIGFLTSNSDTSTDAFYAFFFFFFKVEGLGKDHEILRRRIENGAKELWFFLQSELKKLKNLEGNELQTRIDEFLSDLGHQERYLH